MTHHDPNHSVAVLVSGGVDSSVALFLLREAGFRNLTAFYLKIWLEDELSFMGSCPWEEDLGYAREVCSLAGVPLEVVPLQREYYERVVRYTVEELAAGRTPSPDVMCNRRIKFSAFFEKVRGSFDAVATGHYAGTMERDGLVYLTRSPDPVKDQTYFLSHLTQDQVRKAIFPIGGLYKSEVRAHARRLSLPNRDRKDSQGICFLGKIRYPDFVRHYLGERPGPIVEQATGRVLGRHRGIWFHTIGQRQGLGLAGGPWYVSGKDPSADTIFVSGKEESAEKARDRFTVADLNWIAAPPATDRLHLKLRHGPSLIPCRIELLPGSLSTIRTLPRAGAEAAPARAAATLPATAAPATTGPAAATLPAAPGSAAAGSATTGPAAAGPVTTAAATAGSAPAPAGTAAARASGDSLSAGGRASVVMDTPDAGVAPGQFAVFYDGEICLGGGRIE